ncbi:DUF1853 family protein [Photobacterium sp. MCCC 1A19761]|uniref:DUF1853 family protein n=1 Tax=Photobacterium sp. MCCC 1A19761 TaxID=3115000 RepID=UPI00307F6D04
MQSFHNKETVKQRMINDMQALLHCPSLICAPYVMDEQWLTEFRTHAVLPEVASYTGNRRLGFYYQWLWQQLIDAHPRYRLLAEEVQLTWQKQTLGAIDFLVEDCQTGTIEHWEVAIKFYLAFQHQWPGPNAKDNLDKKTNRMLDHQLQLSDHPAFLEQLAPQYGAPRIKRLLMQGRLFYPHHGQDTGSSLTVNPHALTGTWCYPEHAAALGLKPIDKTQWINPPNYNALEIRLDADTITTPTQAIAPDQQVWFVMPQDWPRWDGIKPE